MKPLNLVFPILMGLCLFSPAAWAADYTEETSEERSFSLRSGGEITVKNTNGEITVQTWNRDGVKVHIRKKARAKSPENALDLLKATEIEIDARSDRIDIRTRFPESGSLKNRQNIDVTYAITVPEETHLDLNTTNGRIEVAEVRGRVQAQSTNGGIRLHNIRGSARIETTNGWIDIAFLNMDSKSAIRAETTNGGIEVSLPRSFQASIKARTTNGSIHTDFPIAVRGKIGKRIDGDINGGGRLLELKTTNGSIKLKEI